MRNPSQLHTEILDLENYLYLENYLKIIIWLSDITGFFFPVDNAKVVAALNAALKSDDGPLR